ERQESAAKALLSPHQQLERFGGGNGSSQVHGRTENAGGVAGFKYPLGKLRKNARQTSGSAGKHIQADAVAAYGRGVDPGQSLFDGVVVDQVTGFKIIRAVQNNLCGAEKFLDIRWDQISDLGFHLDLRIESGD